jgi:regulator of protease activity HflC (stomatin/prohibitin superfamily)
MIWLGTATVLAIVAAIALWVRLGVGIDPSARNAAAARSARATGSLVFVGALVLLALATAVRSTHAVSTGHVGLVYQFGSIVGQTSEGLQLVAPWQDLSEVSTQVQQKKFAEFVAFSKETQDVRVVVSLNYRVSPEAIQTLYRNVGSRWFEVLVEPRVINFFKEETVRYESVDIAPNRERLRLDVRTRLTNELKPFSIDVVELLIDNIDFSNEFKRSIEAKQIATQETLRAEQIVRQKRFEADQLIEAARGEAESVRVRAQGQADANRLLGASLTPEVIQFAAVQKLGDDVSVVIIPAGQGIILDPSSYLAPRR